MSIITAELEQRGIVLPEETAFVVKRVIHTTADFDYAEHLVFTPGAVERGIEALQQGCPIITDTNMAKAGVSKPGLEKLGSWVDCYMTDSEVIRVAREQGTTRATASMEKAAREHPGAILAVGNAPTALERICDLIDRGELRPRLVIGVPVGFVHVEESKRRLTRTDVPYIAAMGRKGGSNVAAAICNALIYMALGENRR